MTHSRNFGAGFTLIETVIVISLTAFIIGAICTTLVFFYQTHARVLAETAAVGQARRGVEEATRHFREAQYHPDGSYPIKTATASTLTFYNNINDDIAIEQVTYRTIAGVLYRTVATSDSVATTTLATSVANTASTPLFRYFNEAGVELTDPVNASQVVSVKTTLIISSATSQASSTITLSSNATLRTPL